MSKSWPASNNSRPLEYPPSNQGDTMNAPIDSNLIDIELKDEERQPCEVWTA
jgi:hypothetical protein